MPALNTVNITLSQNTTDMEQSTKDFSREMWTFFDWLWDLTLLHLITLFILASLSFLVIRYCLEAIRIEDLDKKAVFITGCDSGFGYGLALKCLENGITVFASCMTEQGIGSLKSAAQKLNAERQLDAFLMDVTSEESVRMATKRIENGCEKFGGLHAVVNNAGITGKHIADDFFNLSEYQKVTEINLFGPIRITHAMKKLLKKGRGRIIQVASICARIGLPGLGPYTVSKYGISGYCDVIRQELRPFGISVHILEPGFFNTPLINRQKIDSEIQEAWNLAPEDVKNEYGEQFFNDSRKSSQDFLDTIASSRISLVVDAYFHAITAKFPRSRYQIGWDSILLFIPMSYLPTGLQDYIFAAVGLFLPKPACH